ncbi:OsmC family protein [Brooklawnia cerclae]|uniref:Organic hydroperoxide reductase OsmC/OhrA n=1 Tax=Brooklawnia cerclae TaxID=349934 RepID=A0ABX0SJ54_9ACTN|nr:OsmC family protein [Brooklawnia cerclae]NIH57944.1 organic hydroperoxide reductase OsmC/OhrA [Brooklawnia cerclae]
MPRPHRHDVRLRWTGNLGTGTSSYRAYSRDLEIDAGQAPTLPGSSAPAFRGDPARWNPEQLFVAALAQCHMLWYLHLAADAGIVVLDYVDDASGELAMDPDHSGGGEFASVTLRPTVTIMAGNDAGLALELHDRVGPLCLIARSVRTPVHHEPTIRLAEQAE